MLSTTLICKQSLAYVFLVGVVRALDCTPATTNRPALGRARSRPLPPGRQCAPPTSVAGQADVIR
jgi:hypothetical protein